MGGGRKHILFLGGWGVIRLTGVKRKTWLYVFQPLPIRLSVGILKSERMEACSQCKATCAEDGGPVYT